MKILVIGSEGFIGRHLMEQGRAMGHEMVGCDIVGEPDIPGSSDILIPSDFQCSRVIHAAGVLGTEETLETPAKAVDENIGMTLRVLQQCAKHNVPFTYLTLGNNWLNPYSITKNCAAEFVRMYHHVHGLPTQVAVCYNVFGPYQKWKPVRKIVPEFMTKILRGEPIELFNSGHQECDMVYAPDVARAVLVNDCTHTQHYGSGVARRVGDVLFDCAVAIGKDPVEVRGAGPRPGETGPAAIAPYALKDQTTYEEALKITAEWYRANAV